MSIISVPDQRRLNAMRIHETDVTSTNAFDPPNTKPYKNDMIAELKRRGLTPSVRWSNPQILKKLIHTPTPEMLAAAQAASALSEMSASAAAIVVAAVAPSGSGLSGLVTPQDSGIDDSDKEEAAEEESDGVAPLVAQPVVMTAANKKKEGRWTRNDWCRYILAVLDQKEKMLEMNANYSRAEKDKKAGSDTDFYRTVCDVFISTRTFANPFLDEPLVHNMEAVRSGAVMDLDVCKKKFQQLVSEMNATYARFGLSGNGAFAIPGAVGEAHANATGAEFQDFCKGKPHLMLMHLCFFNDPDCMQAISVKLTGSNIGGSDAGPSDARAPQKDKMQKGTQQKGNPQKAQEIMMVPSPAENDMMNSKKRKAEAEADAIILKSWDTQLDQFDSCCEQITKMENDTVGFESNERYNLLIMRKRTLASRMNTLCA